MNKFSQLNLNDKELLLKTIKSYGLVVINNNNDVVNNYLYDFLNIINENLNKKSIVLDKNSNINFEKLILNNTLILNHSDEHFKINSILRQDPDIILINNPNSLEEFEFINYAIETGHLLIINTNFETYDKLLHFIERKIFISEIKIDDLNNNIYIDNGEFNIIHLNENFDQYLELYRTI